MKILRPGVLVVLAASALAAPAAAQPAAPGAPGAAAATAKVKPIREELAPDARKAWDAAVDLFTAKDFNGARVEFQRAYDLSKNPRVLYNVAVCERQSLHYARAIETFQKELAEGTGKVPPKDLEDIKQTIEVLKPYVASLDLKVAEPGATVSVDDADVPGTTPLPKPIPIDVGKHTVKVRKDGFKVASVEVEAHQGEGAIQREVKLEPLKVTVMATVDVTGATGASVWIDGVDMGPAPFKGQVEVGRHTVTARAPGFVAASQTSDVAAGQALALTLTLAPERHEGKVKIVARPEGAVIEVDQKVRGSSAWEGVLPTGGHQLRVSKTGYADYVTELTVRDDQTRTVDARLVEDKTRGLAFWATGAVVVIAATVITSVVVFKAKDPDPVQGSFDPGVVNSHFHFH